MIATALPYIFLGCVIAYALEHILIFVGVLRGISAPRTGYDTRKNSSAPLPTVTVLVCARDEEINIGRCVGSLSKIDYPSELLQVLIVDDKSTDRTPEILADWQKRMPNLHVLRSGPEIENLRGKANALAQGMDAATGEFVLVTDADSTVSPGWVREYLAFYEDGTGMVASITLQNDDTVFDGLQSVEWSYLLGISMAASNVNMPLSVIGNNMSVRRSAYEGVGGYRKIPFSVTEDFALYRAIWNAKSPSGKLWRVRYVLTEGMTVISQACPDFKAWWRQKHRWVKGGEGLKGFGYSIVILGLAGNISMMLALFYLSLPLALLVIGIKWLADFAVMYPVLSTSNHRGLMKFFPLFELYFPFFVLSMPIMIMQKNVKWKGRVYKH